MWEGRRGLAQREEELAQKVHGHLRRPHLGSGSDDAGAPIVHIDASARELHIDAARRWGRLGLPAAGDTQKRQPKRQCERTLHAFALLCSRQTASSRTTLFSIGAWKKGNE